MAEQIGNCLLARSCLRGTLLLVGFMLKYWWVIALVVAAVILYKRVPVWWAAHEAAVAAERERVAGIAARADQQHRWVLAGDPGEGRTGGN
jgi:hypothetical protein